MRWDEITDRQRLLEAGLSRIQNHLDTGGALGIISAATLDRNQQANEAAHRDMIKRLREHGYGPIQSTGRSQWGPERSLIVPHARLEDLKQIGDEFDQDAVVYVPAGGKKKANLYYLNAAGAKAGSVEEIGPVHFNAPNPYHGITVLKGLGYNPRDTREPTRSFTFGNKNPEGVIETLTIPRGGQLHPLEKAYV
jgi:hypothetical protein